MRYCKTKNATQRAFYLHPDDFAIVLKAVRKGGFKSVAAFASEKVLLAAKKIIKIRKK